MLHSPVEILGSRQKGQYIFVHTYVSLSLTANTVRHENKHTALFDTSPPYAEQSLSYFLLYHTSPVGFVFDKTTNAIQPVSGQELIQKGRNLVTTIFTATLLLNLLLSTNFTPFPSRELTTIMDYFYWGNLANRYTTAYLLGVSSVHLMVPSKTTVNFVSIYSISLILSF